VRTAERDQEQRPGVTTDKRQQLRALQRENAELRRANEIRGRRRRILAEADLGRRGK